MTRIIIIYILVLGCFHLAQAQPVTGLTWQQLPAYVVHKEKTPDTADIFSLAQFQQLVLKNHPIVRQAALLTEEARAGVLQSLGKFDPLLQSSFDRKEFGNRDYYSNWTNQLKVPLWFAGADLKIGYDRVVGDNVNPQYITPDEGLSGVGISIPLGQGLIIDARRNVLRQSRLMTRYAEAERVKQILSVWYTAVSDYWSWYQTYSEYELLKDGVELASTRFVALRGQTLIGDKPPIDTVEARITVQEREIELARLSIELSNRRLLLSNHLWDSTGSPVELPGAAIPEQPNEKLLQPDRVAIDTLVRHAASKHPELLKIRTKAATLDVERSYRRELLKPRIDISGTLITARNRFGIFDPKYYDIGWRNYKVGVDVAFPLFLRAERGKLRSVIIKQDQLQLDLVQTDREIRNSILTSYNKLEAYKNQLVIQVSSIAQQQQLLDAEQQKFKLGESTLFLINSRETKLIDMKVKRAKMIAGYQQSLAELYYKAGTRENF
ncbi:TolC family protein [Paraflavitalea pollutisoli]|uniref:TolC family protein n=1 Tax=Paraflavitalea pollutisoli TaxID=3034143 RepID=UPI0023EA9FFE|nr:TolC family protein [Paraflavitalea sp. H1-2-19X]